MSHKPQTHKTTNTQSLDYQGPLPCGTQVGKHYIVKELLGSGGAGDVYMGIQRPFNRPVAIKVSRKQSGADRTRVTRFIREARAAAQLNHPGIINIYDCGEHTPGVPYLVMEALEGCTLEAWLDENPTPSLVWVKRVIVALLKALSVAHKQGIVHRDLKPANIFMVDLETKNERPILLDFGLAFVDQRGSNVRLTNSGELNGTPQYLPPEYILHQEISPAFDVYQVGLIMAEMLSGFPAVTSDRSYQCLMRHCNGKLDIAPGVLAGPFGSVIRRALSMDPSDRHQDAAELLKAILAVELTVSDRRRPTAVARVPRSAHAARFVRPPAPVGLVSRQSSEPEQTGLSQILGYPFSTARRRQYATLVSIAALVALVFGFAFMGEPTAASNTGEPGVHRAVTAPDSVSTYDKEAIGGSIFDAMSLADDITLKTRALAKTPEEAPSK